MHGLCSCLVEGSDDSEICLDAFSAFHGYIRAVTASAQLWVPFEACSEESGCHCVLLAVHCFGGADIPHHEGWRSVRRVAIMCQALENTSEEIVTLAA